MIFIAGWGVDCSSYFANFFGVSGGGGERSPGPPPWRRYWYCIVLSIQRKGLMIPVYNTLIASDPIYWKRKAQYIFQICGLNDKSILTRVNFAVIFIYPYYSYSSYPYNTVLCTTAKTIQCMYHIITSTHKNTVIIVNFKNNDYYIIILQTARREERARVLNK